MPWRHQKEQPEQRPQKTRSRSIRAKYENTDPQFVKYLEKERARWNKEEEVF